ncbi:MAG: hypothetical protein HY784_01670 [Chloroflexi bacterium]|nr:hypothetical protein [Chloroflexota bacterium]
MYYRTLIGVSEDLTARAIIGGQVAVLLPFVMALNSWFRGSLTARRATVPITAAMGVNLGVMALGLWLGVWLRMPGALLAALALTLSVGAETVTLWGAERQKERDVAQPARAA